MRILQMIIITIVWGISPLYGNWEAFPALNFTMRGDYWQWGRQSTKIDTSNLDAIKGLNKNYWNAYFSGGNNWADFSDFEYDKHIAFLSSYNAATGVIGGSQLVKKFEFPQSIFDEGATKVKVSFDITKRIPISFGINVKPWEASLAPSLLEAGIQTSTGSTIFNIYIISLYSGDIIYSQEGNGANWNPSGVAGETLTASFILDGSNLYAGQDGYALVVESFYQGEASSTLEDVRDVYLVDNFKFEYMIEETIPEPATIGLALLGLGSLLARRKR